MSAESLKTLEEKLGYQFKETQLLRQALTHPSVSYELDRTAKDNQRLEYLGDAALQLSLSALLYERLPLADEGRLTKLRAAMVSTRALALIAKNLDLGTHLIIGRGEAANGGRTRSSTLADGVEAILGAAYLDGGMDALRNVTLRLFLGMLQDIEIHESEDATNPKGRLQEIIQSETAILPEYRITSEDGPPHNKVFQAEVTWQDKVLGSGAGPTKKLAEIEAAKQALQHSSVQSLLTKSRNYKLHTT